MTNQRELRRTAKERQTGYKRFWDEERETMPVRARDALILSRVQAQLHYAYEKLPFYRNHYDAHGFHPDQVRSLEDFTTKVPVITKKMLVENQKEHPPFGTYLGAERDELARIHGSSGTTGTPTMYGVSRTDWARGGQVNAMGLWCAGIRPDDLVQITYPFSLFFGGWGVLDAVELIGATAFPTGSVVPTDRQIELMHDLTCDVLTGTPSYVAHLGRRAAEMGYDPSEFRIALSIVGGEPGGSIPSVRSKISGSWDGAAVVDVSAGSTSEMYPFIANVGCIEQQDGGVHLFQDENYTEIVSDDDPNVPVPAGQQGATVATHLWRRSQPMIRFWMGDVSVLDDEPCSCGRTYPRLPRGVFGRIDDMLIIRGANVYPSAVESAVRATAGAGAEFRIIVDRPNELDEMIVEVEAAPDLDTGDYGRLEGDLAKRMQLAVNVRVPVKVVPPGTHETQTFKARRVVDNRPKG